MADRWRPLQGDAENLVEYGPALVQEDDDPAVRRRAGQQRQHGEQQKRRQGIALALRAPWIGNLSQRIEKPGERYHGNPKVRNCQPKIHIFPPDGRLFLRCLNPCQDPLCAIPPVYGAELNSPGDQATRRGLLKAGFGLGMASIAGTGSLMSAPAAAAPSVKSFSDVIDLTHPLFEGFPTFDACLSG